MESPEEMFVDILALSQKRCQVPMEGLLAYATSENFLGRLVDGYHEEASKVCLLTRAAAEQLCLVQNKLLSQKLSLFIFDAYRPLRAVKDFAQWFSAPPSPYELERKKLHYPFLEKTDLPRLGYAPKEVSRHCFGHVVDVSLFDLETGRMLDMGTGFDYFDEASHWDVPEEKIGLQAVENRKLLLEAMKSFGFIPYAYEWWHFEYEIAELEHPVDVPITGRFKNAGV